MAIKELFNDARPQVLFDPRASQRIDPRFKFTRDGVASYYDDAGLVRFAAANQARIDHNPTTGESLGLFLEAAGTNYKTNSTTLNPGFVFTNTISPAPSATISAPDGVSQTVEKLVENTSTGTHNGSLQFSGVFDNWVTSFFVKAAGRTKFKFDPRENGTFTEFDLTAGTVNGVVDPSRFEKLPNGWFRVKNFTVLSFRAFSRWRLLDASGSESYTGDGVSGIYLWGLQWERATTYSSSYIPTAGSTVTRPAELLTIEAPLPATGSIYIDARSLGSDVDDTLLSAAPASPSTDKLALAIRQPASLYNSKALVYEVDGAFKPTLPFPVPSNAQERNLITYGANNYHYRSDSARYTPSSSSSVPANMTRLGIGHDVTDPTKAMTGYINAVYLWPGEITPTVAEALVRGDVDPKNADSGTFTPEAGALAFAFNTQGTATDGDRVVQLPVSGSTNNILVDWGDNTSSSFIGAAASSTVSHTYSSAGIYPVQITADDDGTNSGLQNIIFYNSAQRNDLVRVLQWGGTSTLAPTTMYRAFRDCTQMDFESGARTNLPDTSAVISWEEAFYNCSSLSGSFPSFNFSGATNFSSAWRGCSSLTAFPAVGDQTDGVTNFSYAWYGCSSLTGFPLINTAAGTSFAYSWYNCSSLTSFPLIDTSSGTSFSLAWYGCSSLTNFPLIDTSSGPSFIQTWQGCSSLTSFPLINTAASTSFLYTWHSCSSLTSFPSIDTSSGTNFSLTWYNCSSLTSFPLINTAAGTNFQQAWYGCSSFTSFPVINTSSGTNFQQTWQGCSSLTGFPSIDTSSGTNFYGAWYGCSSLASFPLINTAAGTNFQQAWLGCSSLISFPLINTSSGTNFYGAWHFCSSLTSFPLIDTSSGTNFYQAWNSCSSLTNFPLIDTSSGTNFSYAWYGCTSLTSFPANFFDSWSPASVSNGCFYLTWFGCTSLTPASVVNILDSIAASGQSAPSGTGTNDKKITIDWDGTGTPATTAAAAITTLKSRNWQIYLNGVLQ